MLRQIAASLGIAAALWALIILPAYALGQRMGAHRPQPVAVVAMCGPMRASFPRSVEN